MINLVESEKSYFLLKIIKYTIEKNELQLELKLLKNKRFKFLFKLIFLCGHCKNIKTLFSNNLPPKFMKKLNEMKTKITDY